MGDSTPSMAEFERLYEAALAFKQQAPWQWMWDSQIWGIRNPDTGEIGYASVMGRLGEHLALAIYHGSEGLSGWYRLSQNAEPENETILLEIPHMQASFEDRNGLTDKDRQVIKSLGLKFRGRQEWPLFRSYVPGYLPWYLTLAEARFLTIALEQTVEMAERLLQDPDALDRQAEGLFLVRTRTEQGWKEEWLEPEPIPARATRMLEEGAAAAIVQQYPARIKRVEVDLYGLTTIQEERGTRPYLGYHLMVVESESHMILGSGLLVADPSLDDMWAKLPGLFVQTMLRFGHLPAEVRVRSDRVHYYLAPVADQLGIRLKVSRRMPALDSARAFHDRMMSR